MNFTSKAVLIGITLALGACGTLETDKVDYRSTGKAPTLDIPPDLTQLSKDTRYTVVDGAVTLDDIELAVDLACVDDRGQVLEVDLMDDAHARRHDTAPCLQQRSRQRHVAARA